MGNEQNQIPNIAPDPSEAGQPVVQQIVKKPNSNKNLIIGLVVAVVVMAIVSIGSVAFLLSKTVLSPIRQDDNVSVSNSTREVVNLKEVCATHEKICVDAPEDWQVSAENTTYPEKSSDMANSLSESELVNIDKVTLTSPDGGQKVGFSSGITGVGGRCDDSSSDKVYIIRKKQTNLTSYGDSSINRSERAYAMSIVTTSDNGSRFEPAVILTNSNSLISKNQEQYCASVFADLIPGRNIVLSNENGVVNHGLVSLSTKMSYVSSSSSKNPTYRSLDEAKQALESKYFKQAFDIIASARY